MASKTNEEALETLITKYLITQHGYIKGDPKNFNKNYSYDEKLFWQFLELTQNEELEKLTILDKLDDKNSK